jgi:hypothetical protein
MMIPSIKKVEDLYIDHVKQLLPREKDILIQIMDTDELEFELQKSGYRLDWSRGICTKSGKEYRICSPGEYKKDLIKGGYLFDGDLFAFIEYYSGALMIFPKSEIHWIIEKKNEDWNNNVPSSNMPPIEEKKDIIDE